MELSAVPTGTEAGVAQVMTGVVATGLGAELAPPQPATRQERAREPAKALDSLKTFTSPNEEVPGTLVVMEDITPEFAAGVRGGF